MLRIGIISDVHGGCVGLDAALEDLRRQGVDRIVALGDMLQGGSEPARVAELLRTLECPVVLGNSDAFVLDGRAAHEVSPATMEIREWTREQIGADGLALIGSFVPTVPVDLEGGKKLLCFHGSPRDYDEVLLPETTDEELAGALGAHGADVLAGGHVHLQWFRRTGDALFFNPGSVGVTYNRHLEQNEVWFYPIAEFAVVVSDGASVRVEMCRIPLDVETLQRAARASGRPYAEREALGYRPPGG